ncbi:type IV secretion system protein VirB5 [Rahnella aquatilis]|nr:type IV secretion system protein VirB5 [Rahnella aquatilis]
MMKKQLLAITLFSCSASAFAVGAGVIVHDAQSSIQTAAQWVKEGKQWVSELQAYQDELLAKTGVRDVQGLVQDAKEISSELTSVYEEGTEFYDDYINDPTGVLSPKAKGLLDKYKVGETCVNQGYSGDLLKGCEARFLSDLATVAYGDKLQENLTKDNENMDGLIGQVKSAKDPKATADATNAIALNQLKFEKLKFQYEMYRDKQHDLAKYKQEMSEAAFRKKQLNAEEPSFKENFSVNDYEMK